MDPTPIVNVVHAVAPAGPPPAFTPPVPAEAAGPVHPGQLGVLPDNSVYLVYVTQDNQSIRVSYNTGLGTPFHDAQVDHADQHVGNVRVVTDALGRLHVAWYANLPNGHSQIRYARKDPGSAAGAWSYGPAPIPGSETAEGYKVVGLACDLPGRAFVLWGRNYAGARYASTADGTTWSPVETVPGPFSATASDFDIGIIRSGLVWIVWMDRDHGILAKQHTANGWSPSYYISREMPGGGQAYTARAVGLPNGNMFFIWTGPSTDGFCRIFDHVHGLAPTVTQLWDNAGSGNSRGVEAVADAGGTVHIAWDDDSGRLHGDLAVLYIRGMNTTWSTPVAPFAALGDDSCCRYPALALAAGALHVATNSNSGGSFRNFYTRAPL